MNHLIRITTIAVLQAVLSVFNSANCQQMTITMKTEGSKEIRFTIDETEEVTIDWGDGASESKPYVVTAYDEDDKQCEVYIYRHKYSVNSAHTVTITGNNITSLLCNKNGLTYLDVSGNTALKYLDCSENRLTHLDVSKNTALTHLSLENNQLTDLDVSRNTSLEYLECSDNKLTHLDVSKNTALESLSFENNQLTHLDVSKNIALEGLTFNGNQLTHLDVSGNIALKYLDCSENKLTHLDVSKNTALRMLDCDDNQLTYLDVSENTELTDIECNNNQFSADALNALFETLHSNDITNQYRVIHGKLINICKNPGTDACNTKIAKKKLWIVKTSD